jgi:hypothetical protein
VLELLFLLRHLSAWSDVGNLLLLLTLLLMLLTLDLVSIGRCEITSVVTVLAVHFVFQFVRGKKARLS